MIIGRTQDESGLELDLATAKKQLRQSAKLAAMGQLAAGMAHEINNPVSYVRSNLGSLQSYITDILILTDALQGSASIDELRDKLRSLDYDFLKSDIQDLLNESLEGLDRVRNIVGSMTVFARSDEDVLKVADPLEGIESTLNIVRNEVKCRATLHQDLKALPNVLCNPAQINQVILNLIVNAAQAMIEFGRIDLRSGTDSGGVWIEVEDSGSGIAVEHMDRLFEPFFTTKPEGLGTGLGLSLSKSIIDRHGGQITAESTVGVGTKFRLWIPFQPETSSH